MDSTSATILIAIHIMFSLFVALIAIMIYFVDDAEELLDELNEFKNTGTIKGVKTCQISKSWEKAKAKS